MAAAGSDAVIALAFIALGIGFKVRAGEQRGIAEQALGVAVGRRFHAAQLSLDGAAAAAGGFQSVADRVDLLADLIQHRSELAELGTHRAQHLPDFAGTLFDGQGAETHAQGIENGRQRGRPGHHHTMLALQVFDQARATQHFGVQAFGGQEHDGEVGGMRRRDILGRDVLRLVADAPFERSGGEVGSVYVGAFLGIEQALVVFARKLALAA
jgi:hypothetical protein